MKGLESNTGVKVFNWKDKRTVLTLSTIPEHETKLVASGKSSRSGDQIKKPQSVLEYNNAKKGIDLSDQMSSYYTPLKKKRKWYRKVAF